MADKVPRLVANIDVRKFKLDPMDGFLLTRIDGRLGPKDLAREMGLPDFSVERALEKLEKLGVIENVDPSAPPPPPKPSAAPEEKPTRAPPRGPLLDFASDLSGPKYDPKELEEECDLPPEVRKRILDLYYRLDDLDHYTMLGITHEADKKGVKRAYFEAASHLHPDRYFKKNIGSFKAKVEILFARITEAHDTLVDAGKRAEYDEYLAAVATTQGMEAMFERALEEARAVQEAEMSPPSRPVPITNPPVAPSQVPEARASVGPRTASTLSADEIRSRKDALARRLLGQSAIRPTARNSVPAPAPDSNPLRYNSSADAVDALRRRYEARIESANTSQSSKYRQVAEEALDRGDVVAAANSFHLATRYAPHDVDLAIRYQEVKNQADLLMADNYRKQALYEEKQAKWADAAKSWERVTKTKPDDSTAHYQLATCLLQAEDGDLHAAAEHAKQAVLLQPDSVTFNVTLAEVYVKAGLHASARRAAEQANQLDPKNPAVQALLKRIGK